MADDFKVRVFAPLAHEGSALGALQAAIRIADELGIDVQVHPMDKCPDAEVDAGRFAGVTLAAGRFDMSKS